MSNRRMMRIHRDSQGNIQEAKVIEVFESDKDIPAGFQNTLYKTIDGGSVVHRLDILCRKCGKSEVEFTIKHVWRDPYLENNFLCERCYESETKAAIASRRKPRTRWGSDDDWAEYYALTR